MDIPFEIISKHVDENRNARGIYIFHNLGLYMEMRNNLDNYFTSHGCFYLLPGVSHAYQLRDAKEYLQKMMGV